LPVNLSLHQVDLIGELAPHALDGEQEVLEMDVTEGFVKEVSLVLHQDSQHSEVAVAADAGVVVGVAVGVAVKVGADSKVEYRAVARDDDLAHLIVLLTLRLA
jgi:hypothetical protein